MEKEQRLWRKRRASMFLIFIIQFHNIVFIGEVSVFFLSLKNNNTNNMLLESMIFVIHQYLFVFYSNESVQPATYIRSSLVLVSNSKTDKLFYFRGCKHQQSFYFARILLFLRTFTILDCQMQALKDQSRSLSQLVPVERIWPLLDPRRVILTPNPCPRTGVSMCVNSVIS